MKKYVVMFLCVLVVLAFAVTSFARHQVKDMFEYKPQIVKSSKAQITLGGEIRVRGEISNNNEDFRKTDDDLSNIDRGNCLSTSTYDTSGSSSYSDNECRDSEAAWNQRVRLNLKATVSPNTLGFIELESQGPTSDTWTWGQYDGAAGIYGKSNAKNSYVYIRQAYIAHQGSGLTGMPAGFKVGHMLLGLGNGLFYDHTKFGDDALLFWIAPMEGTEISFIAIKLDEGTGGSFNSGPFISEDADAYVLTGETAMNGINLSADVTYLIDNEFNTLSSSIDTSQVGDDRLNMNLWNFGLRADTDVEGINVYGDFEFQTGEAKKFKTNRDDLKLRGWAGLLGAEVKVGDITVGIEGAYGSGDDIETENKYDGFINSIGSGQHFTYLYDQHARTAGQTPVGTQASTTASSMYANVDNTGLNNTWYLNLGASTNVNPDVKVAADLYYLRASQKVAKSGVTPGTYVEDQDKKDIGVELDGKVTYQLDTNVVYYVEAGYLWAGNFYTNVTADKDKIDNPWSVRNGILLKF